ncbi:MAG: exo-alpha-sialidase [Nitrosomonadales bacterium]|nr:exo-alpha-sialidase [Nitrosomonadales bacterium]
MKRPLLLGFILIAFGLGFLKAYQYPSAASFDVRSKTVAGSGEAQFQSRFASSALHTQTHAASLVELKDGRIRAFWFAGSREGAKDVEIRSAVFDPAQGLWSAEQTVASREGTQQSLLRYVSKLGNPVAGRAADGTLWLYYVTVSMGGWAGSSITAMTSPDDGATWNPARRLVSSPFLNISTLVKGAPFFYSDGTMGLPVYHEFIGKFGELLRLDKTGAVIDKQRLSAGKDHGLQPVLLAKNANEALVLMRYSGADTPHRAISISTSDAGQHWTAPVKSPLSNPDSALSAMVLPDGRILAALNNMEQGRDALTLVISADGGSTWRNVYQLEDQRKQSLDEAHYLKIVEGLARDTDAKVSEAPAAGVEKYVASARQQVCAEHNCRFEFSYPYLIRTQNGDVHLVYTWNRSFIKHIWFTQAWLDQRLEKSADDQPH